ncbi:DUF4142 domain-containing protein [Terriglobus aquaticus]|uniref:DUF4142 domain-containing protein n=1 Tax=Terriglobus aquaticus TaxID=940139 RepID=A0ABW9KFB3_9BACT|nr:DUF4142 domain-containing protein [Terriglobus aquaticus]
MKLYAAALATALAATAATSVFAQGFSDKDKTFLKDSAGDNLGEIKAAELALKTTKNPQIREFAQKMITDHKALYAGEKPVATKAGVTLPTTPSISSDATYVKLKVLSGDTFDKEYVKSMVSDHHSDTTKAKTEHDTTQNAEMKQLSAHAGTVMESHTKMIDALAGKMGIQ